MLSRNQEQDDPYKIYPFPGSSTLDSRNDQDLAFMSQNAKSTELLYKSIQNQRSSKKQRAMLVMVQSVDKELDGSSFNNEVKDESNCASKKDE